MQAPSTPEGTSEQAVDVISNIEALLRDDDDDDCYARPEPTVADNQHFFVVSTPAAPLNAKLSALSSTMSTAAPPFRPRGSPLPTMLAGTKSGEGLFSSGPTPPPFSGFAGPIHVTTMSTPPPPPPPPIPRTSSIRDAVKPGFVCLDTLRAFTDKYYAVIVNNLDPRTQTKHLMSIFFPLGAIDALAFQSPVGTEEIGLQFAGRKGGIVLFNSAEMASMAATKIDDFVPHGQTMPLHASYFGRFEDYLAVKGTYTMNRASALSGENGYGPSGGHMHRGAGVATSALLSASAAASVVAANSLLLAASNCPSPVKPLASVSAGVDNSSAQHLASVFLRAAETSDAEADKALDSLLRRFAMEPINRASLVITVLTAIHREQDRLPSASHFLRSLSQYIIQTGLMDPDSPRDLKMSCGTICASMFALQILRGNPFGMALHIINEQVVSKLHKDEEEGAAEGEEGQGSMKGLSVLSDGQINTIDALIVLGKSWYSRAPPELTADKSPAEEEFKNVVKRLKDEGRYPTSLVAQTHSTTPPSLSTPVSRTVPSASTFPSNTEESRGRTLSSSGSEPEAEPISANGTAASSVSSFFVSATPVRGTKSSSTVAVGVPQATTTSVRVLNVSIGSTPAGAKVMHQGPHDVSIESNVSSVGPRYATSAVQTPHKQTFRTTRDASQVTNECTPVSTTGGVVVGGYFTTGVVSHQSTGNGLMPLAHHLAAGQHPLVVGPGASQFNVNVNLLSAFEGTSIQQNLMDATVYMTKVPLNLPHSTLRKLFGFFGEFTKVRICEEKKKPAVNPTTSMDAACAFAHGGRSGYGFVEFAVPASSKAMVDFFRNRSESIPQRMGIDPLQMKEILLMRVSFARSCIHDHDPDDAVFDCSDAAVSQHDTDSGGRKIKACTFGLVS